MAPGTKRFKNCTIAFSDDIAAPDREKYKRWVQYNGGAVMKVDNDTVTHYVVSKRDFRDYTPLVQAVRRKRTIYLMKACWVENSLTFLNKSKSRPLDECDAKYTWELAHAKRVSHHREKKKIERRKELARAKRLAAKEEQEHLGGDQNDVEMDDAPMSEAVEALTCESSAPDKKSTDRDHETGVDLNKVLGTQSVADRTQRQAGKGPTKKMADRFQQALECGTRFDRAVLETERNMTLAGHRPYVDSSGRVHLIMLVRNDIEKMIQEQYQLKSSSAPIPPHREPHLPADFVSIKCTTGEQGHGSRQGAARFQAGKDTQLRYFEDPIHCRKVRQPLHARKSIDRLNDGQCTPTTRGPSQSTVNRTRKPVNHSDHYPVTAPIFHETDGSVPFSSLPTMPYTPIDATTSSKIRVPLPRPFAYSLQMYESFECPKDNNKQDHCDTSSSVAAAQSLSSSSVPQSAPSFTEYLSRPASESTPPSISTSPKSSSTSCTATSTSTEQSPNVTARPSLNKTYTVICQYTRKGTSRASELMTLAPEGSTFEFAMDMFKKFFRKKTGLAWEDIDKKGKVKSGEEVDLGGDSSVDAQVADIANPSTTGTQAPPLEDPTQSSALSPSSTTTKDKTSKSVTTINTFTGEVSSSPTTTIALPSRPFTFVRTDQKVYVDGNEKYKAAYGEDLFVFRCE